MTNPDFHAGSIDQTPNDPRDLLSTVRGDATLVMCDAIQFAENGAGTYVGTIPLPAGSLIIDIGVTALALWTAATSAAMTVGDDASANGFFLSTNLKATDLLAGESNTIEHPGGLAGAYIGAEQRVLYQATARNIQISVTSVGAGTAGRTIVWVVYSVPSIATVTQ